MSQPCKEQDKIRGKFIRAYYSNSAGGGGYKEDLTEAAARAKAAEMRKKGYQFGESELPAKYSCWWGDPAFQHITIEYEAYCKIELTSETAAKLPKNRNRTTIGVGEAVTVRSKYSRVVENPIEPGQPFVCQIENTIKQNFFFRFG